MNKRLLQSIIIRNGDTQRKLAIDMGISLSCLNAKINGKSDFRQNEITFIRNRYSLSINQVGDIFFAKEVS